MTERSLALVVVLLLAACGRSVPNGEASDASTLTRLARIDQSVVS